MSLSDLARATELAKSDVLWALLLLAIIVAVFLAIRLAQTQEQLRKARGRELQAVRQRQDLENLRGQVIDIEAQLAGAQKEMRRAVAIRVKAERRLAEQNTELEEVRRDRDWLKRFVDHVDT